MFWLSVSHHQAVYCFSVYSIKDESPWDHHLSSHNLSRWHCILKLLVNTMSMNQWYILQDKDKMPEEICAYKCWLLSTWYYLFSSFLEKSSVYYPLCADKFFLKNTGVSSLFELLQIKCLSMKFHEVHIFCYSQLLYHQQTILNVGYIIVH